MKLPSNRTGSSSSNCVVKTWHFPKLPLLYWIPPRWRKKRIMMTCSPNLHPFYGCLFQEEERYPSPNIQRGNLGFDLLGSCTFLSAGRKDISSVVITCPPGSHKGSGVILQGKAAVDGSRYLPHQV